jgi:hypothetical protein
VAQQQQLVPQQPQAVPQQQQVVPQAQAASSPYDNLGGGGYYQELTAQDQAGTGVYDAYEGQYERPAYDAWY